MPCPSGILGTKILFVVINLLMIFNWVIQFRAEIREKGNRIKVIGEQIIWWNSEIERLEGMLVEERVSFFFLSIKFFIFFTGADIKVGQKRRQRDIDQQLSEDLLHHSPNVMIPNYERNSVVNLDGIREWDFLVGAKSPKGKGLLGKGPSGLKGLLTVKESKLPKLKKGVKKLVGEKEE